MAEYRVAIVLDAQGRAFVGQVNQATGALTNLRAATDQGGASVGRMAQQTAVMEQRTAGLVSQLRGAVGLITAVLGAAVAREILQTGLALDAVRTKIQGITGDSTRTAAELGFLREVTERLGIGFRGAAEDYASLLAAARGTELAQYTREIAESVLTAGRAYQLGGEQIRGALTAIEQMISKGTVSAEELRGQLGERLPGAFQIAARSMGVTTEELGKMLERGEVVAADFLPRFARELRNATAAGAELAASKPAAEFERLGNAVDDAMDELSAAVLPALAEGARDLAAALREMQQDGTLTAIGEGLGFIARNADALLLTFGLLAGGRAIGAVTVALRGFLTQAALSRVSLAGMVTGASGGVGAMQLLSGAVGLAGRSLLSLAGGPIPLAVAGFALLATGVNAGLIGWERYVATVNSADEAMEGALDVIARLGTTQAVGVDEVERQLQEVRQAAIDTDQQMLDLQKTLEAEAGTTWALGTKRQLLELQQTYNELVRTAVRLRNERDALANRAAETQANDAEANDYLVKLEERIAKERDRTIALQQGEAALIRIRAAEKAAATQSEELAAEIIAQADALADLVEGNAALQQGQRETTKEIKASEVAARDMLEALQEQLDTLGLTEEELILYRAELAAAGTANEDLAQAIRDSARDLVEEIRLRKESEERTGELIEAEEKLTEAKEKAAQASADLLDMERDLNAQLAGPSAEAWLDYQRALDAVTQRELLLREAGLLTVEEQARIARIRSALTEQYMRDLDEIARENDRVGKEVQQVWEGASRSIADAFGDFVASGLDDFESFRESLKDIAKRIVSELISIFVQQKIIIPVTAQLTGQSVPPGFVGPLQPDAGGSWLGAGLQGAAVGSYIGGSTFGGSSQSQLGGTIGGIAGGLVAGTATGAAVIGAGLSAAGLGATLGSVVPIVGTIIGAVLGAAIGSLFASDPRIRVGDNRSGAIGSSRFDTRIGVDSDELGPDNSRQVVEAIETLDNLIAGILDSIPGMEDEFAEITAILSTFTLSVSNSRATLENVLQARFNAILGAFDSDIQQFVRGAGTLEEQVQRLGEVLTLDALVDAGAAVLPTLDSLMDVLLDMQAPGESLLDTYARLAVSTQLLEESLALSGVTLDLTREEFVQFAVDIVEAAGGLQQAAAMWAGYYQEFFTEQERALLQLEQANDKRNDLLAGLGLDGDISNEAFRAAFEAALPTLTADQIVQWLQAGAAIAAANAAQTAYNQTLGVTEEAVTTVADGAGNAVGFIRQLSEELVQARAAYADWSADLQRQRQLLGASDFVSELADIQQWTDAQIAQANELARAAGMEGAAVEDLTAILEISASRTAAAMAEMEGEIADLVGQLWGTQLTDIEAQIALYEQAGQQAGQFIDQQLGGIDQVAQANEQRYQRELQLVQRLHDFVQSLLLDGTLSPLDPAGRLSEAQSQYESLLARAQGGDVEALAELEAAARAYLDEARFFFGSTDAYSDIFAAVVAALQGFELPTDPGTSPTDPGGGGYVGGGPAGNGVAPELAALYAQRDAILAEQEAAQRREVFERLIRFLTEMAAATGENVIALAQRLGVPLEDLVGEIGINLTEMTAGTTQTLAALAARLGVELVDLAEAVGVDLGTLADRQSLLNDALEAQIVSLPTESRDALEPIFRQLEATTDPEEQERLLRELELEANKQPEEIRRLLAPYLEGVDIQTEAQAQLTALGVIEQRLLVLAAIEGTAIEIRNLLAGGVPGLPGSGGGGGVPPTGPGSGGGGGGGLPGTNSVVVPSYAVGTDYVPADGLAYLHQGEAVLTREANAARGAGGGADVVRAIETLRRSSLSAWSDQRNATERVVMANEQVARRVDQLATEVDRLKLVVAERGRS